MSRQHKPIWGEDTIVGHITTGAYGHTLKSCIGLGYVAGAIGGEKFEVEVAGKKYTAEASVKPLYDPDNARIRCWVIDHGKPGAHQKAERSRDPWLLPKEQASSRV